MKIEDFNPFSRHNKKIDGACRIINKDNTQVVCMPDGTVIPRQVWSRVTTDVNGAPHVIVKLLVNVE